jgi:hypothetical protein
MSLPASVHKNLCAHFSHTNDAQAHMRSAFLRLGFHDTVQSVYFEIVDSIPV